jgi:hypothetical protein
MIKIVKPKKELKICPKYLAYRVKYIADAAHPDHAGKGKLVLPSRNYGCGGTGVKHFLHRTGENQELGEIRIQNRKGGGNPTKDLFFELIYSSPKGSHPTPEERDLIEAMIVAEFKGCAIRTAWHINPKTGIHDLHLLISARDQYGNATLSSRFGDGKQTFVSRRNELDQEICDILNSIRMVECEPVHVMHRRNLGATLKTELTRLHEIIAHHTTQPITRANLVQTINEIGPHAAAIVPDDKVVHVTFPGRQKSRPYRVAKLLLQIAETQFDIAHPEIPEDIQSQEIHKEHEIGVAFGDLSRP